MGKKKNSNTKKQQTKIAADVDTKEEQKDAMNNIEENPIEKKNGDDEINSASGIKDTLIENSQDEEEGEEGEEGEGGEEEEEEEEEEGGEEEAEGGEEEAEGDEKLTKDELIERLTEERDSIQEQFDDLLDKISGMKSLFQDMKQSKQELVTTKDQLEEYSSQNLLLRDKINNYKTENEVLSTKVKENDTAVKQLTERNLHLEKELNNQKQEFTKTKDFNEREMEAMKIIRKDLNERVENLELLLNNNNKDTLLYKKELSEINDTLLQYEDTQKFLNTKIEGLENEKISLVKQAQENSLGSERKVIELQSKIKIMLEEKDEQNKLILTLNDEKSTHKEAEETMKILEEQLKFKFAEIAELKSENIKLSQHLQNSLQLLKKVTSTEQIDKELISNLIVTFVSIPRGESRKYEVLELIASFLDWDDLRKKEAGLMYNKDNLTMDKRKSSSVSENSIVGKWTEFLEKESEK